MHVESSNVEVSVVNQLPVGSRLAVDVTASAQTIIGYNRQLPVGSRFNVDSSCQSPLAMSVAAAVLDPPVLAANRTPRASDPEVTAELVERAILHLSTGQLVTGAAQVQ